MKRKRRKNNDLLTFFAGLVMVVAGLYWLTTKISVSSGFFCGTIAFGSFHFNSGLIVVPFIACVVWVFAKPDSFWAKVCVVLSVVLIIAAIIMNTRLHMQPTSLYEYLLMLVFIFGGGAMVLRTLVTPKYKDDESANQYEKYFEEQDSRDKKRKR